MAGPRVVDIQGGTERGAHAAARRQGEVPWWIVVPVALATTGLAYLLPALRVPVSVVWGFGAVAAVALRARREPPAPSAIWWRFAVGGGLLVVGLSIRILLSTDADPYPLPSPADLFLAPAYVVLLLGGHASARSRSGGRPRTGDRVDALIVAGTAALVVWSIVVVPVASDPSLSLVERGFEILYTVLTLGFIYFVVEGGLAPGHPSASHRLLLAFATFLWLIDSFGADDVANRDLGDLLFLAVPIPAALAAAAALEPSARWAFAGPDPAVGDRQTLRFAIAGSVLVVGPLVQLALALGGDTDGGWVAAVGTTLLSVLIFLRLVGLVHTARAGGSDHEQELARLHDANALLRQVDVMARDESAPADVRATAVEVGGRANRLLHAEVQALVVVDNAQGFWVPRLQEGCSLSTVTDPSQLPPPLDQVAAAPAGVARLGGTRPGAPIVREPLVAGSRSGMYAPLLGRDDTVVGVFAVEHPDPDRWGRDDLRLVAGLVELLAITVDNARSVRRLQTRGAMEHRHDTARDLHDQFGQVLTSLGLEVDRLRAADGADRDDLDKLRDAVTDASLEVRAALRALRAPPMGEGGFPAAAEDLVSRLGRAGPTIELVVHDEGRRPAPTVEQQMLGILQEALTNARRHGHARRVVVRWEVAADGASRLEVEDDGVGFVPPTEPGRSIGLVGMAERAELLDGRLQVESAPGAGCRIVAVAPPWEVS